MFGHTLVRGTLVDALVDSTPHSLLGSLALMRWSVFPMSFLKSKTINFLTCSTMFFPSFVIYNSKHCQCHAQVLRIPFTQLIFLSPLTAFFCHLLWRSTFGKWKLSCLKTQVRLWPPSITSSSQRLARGVQKPKSLYSWELAIGSDWG